MNVDVAKSIADAVIKEVTENLHKVQTEEDAKIQIILRFLTEVLGWKHSDVGAERKHDNGFSDFLISDGESAAFLCEAKRIGVLVIETAETKKLRHLKLNGPSLSKSKDGISQAAGYAAPNGISLAVLTDGTQWIVFKSFTPGSNYVAHEAFGLHPVWLTPA